MDCALPDATYVHDGSIDQPHLNKRSNVISVNNTKDDDKDEDKDDEDHEDEAMMQTPTLSSQHVIKMNKKGNLCKERERVLVTSGDGNKCNNPANTKDNNISNHHSSITKESTTHAKELTNVQFTAESSSSSSSSSSSDGNNYNNGENENKMFIKKGVDARNDNHTNKHDAMANTNNNNGIPSIVKVNIKTAVLHRGHEAQKIQCNCETKVDNCGGNRDTLAIDL